MHLWEFYNALWVFIVLFTKQVSKTSISKKRIKFSEKNNILSQPFRCLGTLYKKDTFIWMNI